MYYEEKVIGGELHFRTSPTGEWRQVSLLDMTRRLAESEARAEGLRKLLTEMIELRQATQDGRVTERHELEIVRDAKAAIAQEAEREVASG